MLSWLWNLGKSIAAKLSIFFANGNGYVHIPSLQESLVLRYRMDDNAATTVVLDSSGHGYHGTSVRNTNLMHVEGKVGGAFEFDSITDYINTGRTFHSTFIDSFTVCFWTKPSTDTTYFFGKINQISAIYCLHSGRTILFGYEVDPVGGETVIFREDALNLNEWNFICCSTIQYSPTEIYSQVYVNGVLIVSGYGTTVMNDLFENGNLGIGCWLAFTEVPVPTTLLNGALDDFTIFNKALSQEEISFLYNNGNGRESLAAEYNLNMDGSELVMSGD